jgi:hypothetical protein
MNWEYQLHILFGKGSAPPTGTQAKYDKKARVVARKLARKSYFCARTAQL